MNRALPGEGDACWRFKARLWESPTKSRDIPPFSQCNRIQVKGGDMTRVLMFPRWAGFDGPQMTPTKETTGLSRDEGPVPPDSPFPNSVPYQNGVREQLLVAPELEPEGAATFNKAVTALSPEANPQSVTSAAPKSGVTVATAENGLRPDGSCSGTPPNIVKKMMSYNTTYKCVDGQMMTAAIRKLLADHKQQQKALTK